MAQLPGGCISGVSISADSLTLLRDLGDAGYGWLRPEGVRRELKRMTAEWEAGITRER